MSFSIETIKEYTGAGFKCALFDFDGTISLIREGWQEVMVPYFCEVIEALGTGESEDGIREEVTEFVDRLTGKQTIFQCIYEIFVYFPSRIAQFPSCSNLCFKPLLLVNRVIQFRECIAHFSCIDEVFKPFCKCRFAWLPLCQR